MGARRMWAKVACCTVLALGMMPGGSAAAAAAAGGAALAIGSGGGLQNSGAVALRTARVSQQGLVGDGEGRVAPEGLLLRLRGGAKSKNHTNHNQSRKAHKNGIKRAKT
jgi:hypothetical protein